jgi:prepilin-type N-terminal cleavage/methylation domain-containing protein
MRRNGFTLIELTISVAIIALLAAIATPNMLRARTRANETVCFNNRTSLERAEQVFVSQNQRHSESLAELQESGLYLSAKCPQAGTYFWVDFAPESPLHMTVVGCSKHGVFATEEQNEEIFAKILFTYDFSGTLDDWKTLLGSWKIEDGVLVSKGGSYNMIVLSDADLTNGTIGVTTQITHKRGSSAIMFRTNNNKNKLDDGYGLEIDRGRNKFIFTVVTNGRYKERDFLGIPKDFDWAVPHRMEVKLDNDRFTLLVDGNEVMTSSDSTHSTGSYGVYADRKDITFDDIEVREPEPAK